jgi:hypothetical protein
MSHPLPPGTTYAIHLRADSPSGGTKDWVGSTDGTVITTMWGKTGRINNSGQKKGNSHALMNIRDTKFAKGYQIVDTFTMSLGWESIKSQKPLVTKPKQIFTQDLSKICPAPVGAIDFDF